MESLNKRLGNLSVEFKETLNYLKEEFNLSEREIQGIYLVRDLYKNPKILSNPGLVMPMMILGYSMGGLFSTCGDGAPLHECIKRKSNGSIGYEYGYRCRFHLLTPFIPKVEKSLESGLLTCVDLLEGKVKWGIMGQGTSIDEHCKDIPFHDICTLNQFDVKFKPASETKFMREFVNLIERKNENYAKYNEKVHKHLKPIIFEIPMKLSDIISDILKFDEEAGKHYRI